ncbi:hypothetical protein PPERSA_05085 [Pseudocohnilembus persalinus]|uniref:Dienelactone hydrolase domain-containing protein n=1 Tax=Pseudocohnilembus persalinus TaxID=266149 RepID=A0A0V0QX15_PSEPJ|nr:hypothetical protein PPERSA_05085 [Pseudocohnilembus persalinus]|eukprot:KRX06472.1 hypothetical protein PPERSA_05085 [Pseudocohnilembus persalinus]
MDNTLDKRITTRKVNTEFPVEGSEKCPAYLSTFSSDSKIGLILIQEWWGVNESICNTADKFAKAGFQVLVPDLYRGKIAKDTEDAGHLLNELQWDQAIKDIGAAGKLMKTNYGCEKVGILGFCMGGALTIASLSAHPDLFYAGSPYYGIPDLNKFPLKNIKVPVLAHFGEKDDMKGFSDQESAQKLQQQAKELKLDFHVKIYPNAGHAFMNSERPDVFKPEIYNIAFQNTVEFFNKNNVEKL